MPKMIAGDIMIMFNIHITLFELASGLPVTNKKICYLSHPNIKLRDARMVVNIQNRITVANISLASSAFRQFWVITWLFNPKMAFDEKPMAPRVPHPT